MSNFPPPGGAAFGDPDSAFLPASSRSASAERGPGQEAGGSRVRSGFRAPTPGQRHHASPPPAPSGGQGAQEAPLDSLRQQEAQQPTEPVPSPEPTVPSAPLGQGVEYPDSPLNDLEGFFTIDSVHSSIGFWVVHAMVTKVRGRFESFKGTAQTNKNLQDSAIMMSIKASSVDTRDEGRDAHLTSPDFFDVATHPAITFTSTDIRLVGPTTLQVTGDLTIRDVTRPVSVNFEYNGMAVDPFGNTRVGLEGRTTISRADFGVRYNALLEAGGVLVSDTVTLEFEISAIKNS